MALFFILLGLKIRAAFAKNGDGRHQNLHIKGQDPLFKN